MTETALAEAALFYLSRFASSSGNLRRVLMRKLAKSADYYGDDAGLMKPVVEALVARHTKSGAINDALYADAQVRKLRRRGGSARAILQTLNAKGVPGEVIAETGAAWSEGDDRTAAMLFARRRRLGPFRQANRIENRQRDLAALGRAGFRYQVAAMIVDAEDIDTLAELLAEA